MNAEQEIFEHWQVGTLFSTLVTKDSSIMFIPCDQIKQDTFWFDLCKRSEPGGAGSAPESCCGVPSVDATMPMMPRANPFAGGHVKSSSCPKPPLCACSKRSESQRWCSPKQVERCRAQCLLPWACRRSQGDLSCSVKIHRTNRKRRARVQSRLLPQLCVALRVSKDGPKSCFIQHSAAL